jgi:hypothetical protein
MATPKRSEKNGQKTAPQDQVGQVNGHADPPLEPLQAPPPETRPDPPPREHDDRPNTPVFVSRYGLIKATVWANQTDQGIRYNTVITRIYKGAGDAWFSTPSLGYRDLPLVEKAAAAAFQFISEQYANSDVPF